MSEQFHSNGWVLFIPGLDKERFFEESWDQLVTQVYGLTGRLLRPGAELEIGYLCKIDRTKGEVWAPPLTGEQFSKLLNWCREKGVAHDLFVSVGFNCTGPRKPLLRLTPEDIDLFLSAPQIPISEMISEIAIARATIAEKQLRNLRRRVRRAVKDLDRPETALDVRKTMGHIYFVR